MKPLAEPKTVPLKKTAPLKPVLAGFVGGLIIFTVFVIIAMMVGGTWADFVFVLRGGKTLSTTSTLTVCAPVSESQTQRLFPPHRDDRAYVVAASAP